jgi:hypothetical protein
MKLASPLRFGGKRRGENSSEASDEGAAVYRACLPAGAMLAPAAAAGKARTWPSLTRPRFDSIQPVLPFLLPWPRLALLLYPLSF